MYTYSKRTEALKNRKAENITTKFILIHFLKRKYEAGAKNVSESKKSYNETNPSSE